MAKKYTKCINRINQAAGRKLSDADMERIFTRIHQAALDIKNGRAITKMSTKSAMRVGWKMQTEIEQIAAEAAEQLKRDTDRIQRQGHLQILKVGARTGDIERLIEAGVSPMKTPEFTLVRNYQGVNVDSVETLATGRYAELTRKLLPLWDALGNDFLGFWRDKTKELELLTEMRREDSGNPLAKKGAKAWLDVADEAVNIFNREGGDISKLEDWANPQHHSQLRVANAANSKVPLENRKAWVDFVLPMMQKTRDKGKYYVDEQTGLPWDDARLTQFLEKAWNAISTNGISNMEPGASGGTKRANRHREHRQIHFPDAASQIAYWERFGERTFLEITMGHIEAMAKDIAFVQHYGPNPDITKNTIRDLAQRYATVADPELNKYAHVADPTKTEAVENAATDFDALYAHSAGQIKKTINPTFSAISDGLKHANVWGKLGGAMFASLFGDRPMAEAVRMLNHLPAFQSWTNQVRLFNPANVEGRRALMQQGLMLNYMRSTLQRFGEQLGQTSFLSKIASASMRMQGMNAVNELPKGGLGITMMDAIGNQIKQGVEFAGLHENDMRLLRNYGINASDWGTWKLAKLESTEFGDSILTPESIARISDDDMRKAGVIGQFDGPEEAARVRDNAIVKLLGAVNSETEFAIVTPGWKEQAQFYSGVQKGSFKGEIWRHFLQFKTFPWTMFQRVMDVVANQPDKASKAGVTAGLILATTLAGAMIIQTREMLSGRDPLSMVDDNWWKFWGKAFFQGGAFGIYGDFLYGANQTRYGSGWAEAISGPTLGPLVELALVQPTSAALKAAEGKPNHLWAEELQDAKGFVPFNNFWPTKVAFDNMLWASVFEQLSPGYISAMRAKTLRDFGQDRWWQPGELTPERMPAFEKAIEQ